MPRNYFGIIIRVSILKSSTHSDLDIIFGDVTDLQNPPRIDDHIFHRLSGQKIKICFLSKEPEFSTRTVRVHQIDILVSPYS